MPHILTGFTLQVECVTHERPLSLSWKKRWRLDSAQVRARCAHFICKGLELRARGRVPRAWKAMNDIDPDMCSLLKCMLEKDPSRRSDIAECPVPAPPGNLGALV